jgi:diguanylate cyclase (GGDEF)-like protein
MVESGPLASAGAGKRLLPFVAASLFAFATLLVPPRPAETTEMLFAFGLLIAIGVFALALPWRRLPLWTQAAPPLAYLAVVAIGRDAGGGSTSGFALLALLPVFWFALYGTRRQLYLCLATLGSMFVGPLLLIGAPQYPDGDWRRGVLGIVVGAIVGLAVQRLTQERASLLAQLERLARLDALTGLPNLRAWEEKSVLELARARRSGQTLNVAIVDIDSFKRFNDRHGHPAGDRLLKTAVAEWLVELRETDMLARNGGDEFAVALPACPPDVAARVLERMRGATPYGQTCSVGLASWDGSETIAELVERADKALYDAKKSGRNQIRIAPSRMLTVRKLSNRTDLVSSGA